MSKENVKSMNKVGINTLEEKVLLKKDGKYYLKSNYYLKITIIKTNSKHINDISVVQKVN